MLQEHQFQPDDIDRIDVVTAKQDGIGFDDPAPENLSEMQFSLPYMLAAALLSGAAGGPNWFIEATAKDPRVMGLTKRITMTFDDECQTFFNATNLRLSKVTVTTKSGQQYYRRVEHNGEAKSSDEIRDKFVDAASQVIDRKQVEEVLDTIRNLESTSNISQLTGLLAPFLPKD